MRYLLFGQWRLKKQLNFKPEPYW